MVSVLAGRNPETLTGPVEGELFLGQFETDQNLEIRTGRVRLRARDGYCITLHHTLYGFTIHFVRS